MPFGAVTVAVRRRPYCRDVEQCLRRSIALSEPPDFEEWPDEFADSKPEDYWVCGTCEGSGEVFDRRDWETGAYEFVTCPWCKGLGEEIG